MRSLLYSPATATSWHSCLLSLSYFSMLQHSTRPPEFPWFQDGKSVGGPRLVAATVSPGTMLKDRKMRGAKVAVTTENKAKEEQLHKTTTAGRGVTRATKSTFFQGLQARSFRAPRVKKHLWCDDPGDCIRRKFFHDGTKTGGPRGGEEADQFECIPMAPVAKFQNPETVGKPVHTTEPRIGAGASTTTSFTPSPMCPEVLECLQLVGTSRYMITAKEAPRTATETPSWSVVGVSGRNEADGGDKNHLDVEVEELAGARSGEDGTTDRSKIADGRATSAFAEIEDTRNVDPPRMQCRRVRNHLSKNIGPKIGRLWSDVVNSRCIRPRSRTTADKHLLPSNFKKGEVASQYECVQLELDLRNRSRSERPLTRVARVVPVELGPEDELQPASPTCAHIDFCLSTLARGYVVSAPSEGTIRARTEMKRKANHYLRDHHIHTQEQLPEALPEGIKRDGSAANESSNMKLNPEERKNLAAELADLQTEVAKLTHMLAAEDAEQDKLFAAVEKELQEKDAKCANIQSDTSSIADLLESEHAKLQRQARLAGDAVLQKIEGSASFAGRGGGNSGTRGDGLLLEETAEKTRAQFDQIFDNWNWFWHGGDLIDTQTGEVLQRDAPSFASKVDTLLEHWKTFHYGGAKEDDVGGKEK
ncbi:unnamed protein product [Amoebophrya sp. A120]|nr:unnamed protein product [Amoebophrya sp. A120]|eukprot:GSA120T00021380001.1